MEKKITKSLIVLGIIVFSFVISNNAFARYNPYDASYWLEPVSTRSIDDYTYGPNYYGAQGYQQGYYQYQGYSSNNYYPSSTQTQTQTTKPTSSVVNNYYYQSAPKTTTTEKVVTNTNTTTSGSYRDTTNNNGGEGYYNNGLGASAAYSGYNITNGVTALSLRGSGSFMPSSIWQWLLVVILILAIIVVARMIYHRRMVAQEIQHGPAH